MHGGRGAYIYYSYARFNIQLWIDVNAECYPPAALTRFPPPSHIYLLTRSLGGPQHLLGDFGRKKDLES